MLYICIPAYNEESTIGVLLWRIRKVLQDFDREYELLVYNDAEIRTRASDNKDKSTDDLVDDYLRGKGYNPGGKSK